MSIGPFKKKMKYATALSKAKSQGANPVPFDKIVISSQTQPHTDEGWFDVLNECILLSNLKLRVPIFQTKDKVFCLLQICNAGILSNLAEGEGCDNFEAKLTASKTAFEILLKKCYTLKDFQTPEAAIGDEIDLEQILTWSDKKEPDKVSENNIGARMMKNMGWTGGGLGKDGTGITEPITTATTKNRSGIGHNPDLGNKPKQSLQEDQFKGAIKNLLQDFIRRKASTKLFFSSSLSSNQKKIIESCVKFMGKQLKCQRLGKNNDTPVVSPVVTFTTIELVRRVMSEGGKTHQYIVFPPDRLTLESFEALFQKKLDSRPPQVSLCSDQKFTTDIFEKIFVLSCFQNKFASGWTDVLVLSIAFSKLKIIDHFDRIGNKVLCSLEVCDANSTFDLGEGEGCNEVEAKLSAATDALEEMLKNCYTVKVPKVPINNVLDTEDVLKWSEEKSGLTYGNDGTSAPNPMNEGNLRHPRVQVRGKIKTVDDIKFEDALNNMLEDFTKRKPLTNLVFSPRLPRFRKEIIKYCVKFNWKSKLTYETVWHNNTSYPYISSNFEPDELVKKIISEGGKTDQYAVYPPNTLTLEDLRDQLEKKIDFRNCTMVNPRDLGLGDGNTSVASFESAVIKLFKDFVERQPQKPLAFPSDLSNSQRALIHAKVRERKKRGIKSKSYGMDPNRFIVVYMNDEEEFLLV